MTALFTIYRTLFARELFYPLNKALFLLSVRGLGLLNFDDDRTSGEQHLVSRVLPRQVRTSRPVFVDVGANEGDYTELLLARFPNASVHAFEPHPATYSRLAVRPRSGEVKCHNIALGDREGLVTLYDRADAKGSEHASVHGEVFADIHQRARADMLVQQDTLDNIAEREGLRFIDFLKIDTEGSELAVLRGARKLLTADRIGCIHFEFNEMNIISRVFFRDFRKLLSSYRLFRLLPHGLLPLNDNPLQTELFAYKNVFAVKKSA